MSWPKHEFKDEDNYIVPSGNKDYLRGTIRQTHFAHRDQDEFDALGDEFDEDE